MLPWTRLYRCITLLLCGVQPWCCKSPINRVLRLQTSRSWLFQEENWLFSYWGSSMLQFSKDYIPLWRDILSMQLFIIKCSVNPQKTLLSNHFAKPELQRNLIYRIFCKNVYLTTTHGWRIFTVLLTSWEILALEKKTPILELTKVSQSLK